MASTITRRPLPALVLLVALLALTGIVWWRVLHRDTDRTVASTVRKTCAPPPATPTRTLAPPSGITVAVLNSTDRAGIAAKARVTLIRDGFTVPRKAGNDKASVTIASTAEIRYGPAAADAATLLRYYFPGSTLVRERTRSTGVTVSLGAKYTAVATPEAVSAALTRARLAVATTPAGATPTRGATGTGGSPSGSSSPSPSAAATC